MIGPTAGLPRRRLGRTGFEIAALGMGAGWIGELPGVAEPAGDEQAIAAVRRAIDLGIDYFDTAPSYRGGRSERRLGLALRGGWRDRVRLATKAGTHPSRWGDYSAAAITWTVEQSLRVLGTDVIDVLLVHDPQDMVPVLAPGGALEALERLKARGTICAIGLGVRHHGHLRLAAESGRFDVIQTPYDYNLLRITAAPLLALAAARDVGCINASPYQQGLLAGIEPDEANARRVATGASSTHAADLERARAIWRWAQAQGADLRAMAVQFCLREPRLATTLLGPRTATEVEEAVAAARTPVPAAQWTALEALLPTLPPAAPGGEA